ncbi:nardilysin-like isoform X2 [Odontomachus brunneus]|nr:nardilysin-like isoform X2 [Odontomachus brunneus]
MTCSLSFFLQRLVLSRNTSKSVFLLSKMVKRSAHDTPEKERETNQHSAATNLPNKSHPANRSAFNPNRQPEEHEAHGGAMGKTAGENRRVEYLETPVKSEADKKEYRVIKLENGLIALLISDMYDGSNKNEDSGDEEDIASSEDMSDDYESGEEDEDEDDEDEGAFDEEDEDEDDYTPTDGMTRQVKMAACAMTVGVGSFSDPTEIQGLAHFLEHMIFMGSEKYPKENDFDAFVSKYGGYSNAVTGFERTTFHFSIQRKHLLSAVDRFAQFFIKPLMKRDAITRERKAVESEFQMDLPVDRNKKMQLLNSFACDGHPARKFSWGNMTTLRDNVSEDKLYDELHRFRERHYSAHRMRLAIQAKFPLDTLEEYVTKCFSDIPNNGQLPDDFTEFKGVKSFDTPAFRKMYKVRPIKDLCAVELTWVMPSMLEFYRIKPDEYLISIIANSSPGSLISYLRKKLWCIEINCDNANECDTSIYNMYCLSLLLTDEGYKHLEEVLDAVFSYINLLKREGPQKRYYDEIQQIDRTNFRFLEEEDAEDYVEDMSDNMFIYPPREYITGNCLFFEYNADVIQMCLDCLVPDNVNITVYSKKFDEQQFDKFEPWFETKYMDSEIPPEWIERWKGIEPFPSFHLPLPNMFLVNDFSMIPLSSNIPSYPEKVYHDENLEIWYREDPKFRLPDCHMAFYLISDMPCKSTKNAVLLDLYVVILNHLLSEELYPAAAVGYNYDIVVLMNGIALLVNGFNEKLPLLLMTVAKHIVDFPNLVTKDFVEVMKTHLTKQYFNSFLKPGNIVSEMRLGIVTQVFRTEVEKHAVIQDIGFDELLEFVKFYLSRLYVQCLVQGNMMREDVVEKVRQCIGILQCEPLQANTRPMAKITQLPLGIYCCKVRNLNPTDVNSVVLNYYQLGVDSDQMRAMIHLMLLMLEEPMFNQLRTKEQLGYEVRCDHKNSYGVLGVCITVFTQADKYTTEHVDERIEEFMKSFATTLENITDDELNSFKETLKKKKMCADIYLKQEFDRNWTEIEMENYMFDRLQREVVALRAITLDDLKKWYAKYMMNGEYFRKLSLQVIGNNGATIAEAKTDGDVSRDIKLKETFNMTEVCKKDKTYCLKYVIDEQLDKKVRNIIDIEDFKKQLDIYPMIRNN